MKSTEVRCEVGADVIIFAKEGRVLGYDLRHYEVDEAIDKALLTMQGMFLDLTREDFVKAYEKAIA
jgi:hypothetical protein